MGLESDAWQQLGVDLTDAVFAWDISEFLMGVGRGALS